MTDETVVPPRDPVRAEKKRRKLLDEMNQHAADGYSTGDWVLFSRWVHVVPPEWNFEHSTHKNDSITFRFAQWQCWNEGTGRHAFFVHTKEGKFIVRLRLNETLFFVSIPEYVGMRDAARIVSR